MTRFWRDGFWRTSVYGNRHWVEGHSVERDNWSRNSDAHYGDIWRSHVIAERAHRSWFARFVNPNANCPECGAPVFFYQNEHGSRVFFDELGPPWPKHPCTDLTGADTSGGERSREEPRGRASEAINRIGRYADTSGTNFRSEFESKYEQMPWDAFELCRRFKGQDCVLLILRPLAPDTSKKVFAACKALPRTLKEGAVVFANKRNLAYFDVSAMQPAEAEMRRIRSASALVDAMSARPE